MQLTQHHYRRRVVAVMFTCMAVIALLTGCSPKDDASSGPTTAPANPPVNAPADAGKAGDAQAKAAQSQAASNASAFRAAQMKAEGK